jgi:hypothetical protein
MEEIEEFWRRSHAEIFSPVRPVSSHFASFQRRDTETTRRVSNIFYFIISSSSSLFLTSTGAQRPRQACLALDKDKAHHENGRRCANDQRRGKAKSAVTHCA